MVTFRFEKVLAFISLFLAASGTAFAQSTPATMPSDSWLAVPNSHMRDVAPTNGQFAGTWGITGPPAVMNSWCGGALDSQRNRLVLWGGGHEIGRASGRERVELPAGMVVVKIQFQ